MSQVTRSNCPGAGVWFLLSLLSPACKSSQGPGDSQTTPTVSHPVGNVVATRALAGAPFGVAVSAQGVIFVSLGSSNALIKGDLGSMTFGGFVVVGIAPREVAFSPAGTRAYTAVQDGRTLAIVDLASGTVANAPLGAEGLGVSVRPDGRRIYVTGDDGNLSVFDAASRALLVKVPVGTAAEGMAFSPNGLSLYVSSQDAGTITAINPLTNEVVHTYHVGGSPLRLAVSPDGSELYVADGGSGLEVVNLTTGVITPVPLGTGASGLGITPDGQQLYVLLPTAGEIWILDRATRALVKSVSIGGTPQDVAFDASGTNALVTNQQSVTFIQ